MIHHRNDFIRSVLMILLAVSIHITLPGRAAAQDRLILPPPISSSMLDQFADRLELADAQRSAWRRAHLDYQHRYREQRTAYLDQLLPLRRDIGEPPFDAAAPASIRRYYSIYRQAMDQLITIDRELLRSIESRLTEEQAEMLPAVIALRQRDVWSIIEPVNRWRRHDAINFHGSRVDLYAVLSNVDLDENELRRLRSILDRHTTQLAHELSELYRQTARLHQEWAQRVSDAAGDEPPSMGARAEPYIELAIAARRAYERVLQREHDALNALLNALDAESTWRIFVEVAEHHGAYPTTLPIRRFDRLIPQLRDAGIAERAIDDCRSALRSAFDAIARRAIEENAARPPGMGASIDANRQLREETADRMNPARERIKALIPHVRDDGALVDALRGIFSRLPDPRTVPSREQLSRGLLAQFEGDLTPDDHVPGPLSREAVRLFADAANLTVDQRQVLDQLHHDYERSFLAIRRNEVNEIVSVFVGFRVGESGMGQFSPPEDVERKHEARIAARRAIDELDRRFIDDVAMAVLDQEASDQSNLLELLRAGEARTRGSQRPQRTAGGDLAYRADPLRAILTADVDRDEVQTAIEAIAPHAPMLIEAMRAMYEAELELQYVSDRTIATMRKENREEALQQWSPRREQAQRMLRETRRRVVELSLETLETVEDAVSPNAMQQTLESFLRMAYPSVYDDEDAQHTRFIAAFKLDSLSPSQRDRLTDAWLAYQQAYREVSWRMVEAIREPNHYGIIHSPEERAAVERSQNQSDNLRLERQQINDEASLAFETVLNPTQREALARVAGGESNRTD